MLFKSRLEKQIKLEIMIIGVLIIGIILSLVLLLRLIKHDNNTYIDKYKIIDNIVINYPKLNNKKINKKIVEHISNMNNSFGNKIKYNINFIGDKISILFYIQNEKNEITKYYPIIFSSDGNVITNDDFIINRKALDEKIMYFAKLNNIDTKKYKEDEITYHLGDNSLFVMFQNFYNEIDTIGINYNEIKKCLNIVYNYDENYEKTKKTTTKTTLTTTSTTTTTTKNIIVDDISKPEIENIEPILPSDNENQTLKYVAFTFDDGPSKYTVDIMNILAEYGANATFFQVGYMIKSNGDITKQAFERGFEIGNHSSDHSNFSKLSKTKIIEKIEENNKYFNEITNSNMNLIRLPYGSGKAKTKEAVDYPIIGWSVDSRDWESRNTNKIVTTVMKDIKDGDIVLFHDLYNTTKEAIKILVPKLYSNGYKIVSVTELFRIKNIELQGKMVYNKAQ